ncbi:amino acid/amide ABC transporter membrane protein 1 (HAAT family) [Haloactinospora alba]|uniref:Amino acid/amide ABC transporter membrane protein 1 (HAAT family) n=1 Tax=Haloactinospora alba TaxID=405555 RepID=A0A543NI18_9ACTN|nr:branched-chain amino acid ABC transporter permease [Haloactinospora alba]TQN31471.1 amino acid/amide ABC transporter membrane protein 1 (HAAT family) [Haloactinospora alba]
MRTYLVTVPLAVMAAMLAIPVPASADAGDGESLQGQISAPESDDEGVEGIEILVSQDGQEVATATTDADGNWEVELPDAGEYHVVLEEDSVPGEYELKGPAGPERDVTVGADKAFTVVYPLAPEGEAEASDDASSEDPSEDPSPGGGEESAEEDGDGAAGAPAVDSGDPFGEQVINLTVAGVLYGLIIGIASVGLSLIFGTTRMINFAHGDMVTFGAIMAMLFSWVILSPGVDAVLSGIPVLGLVNPLVLGTVLAVVCGGLLGLGLERFLWRPLRRRNVALIQMFIVTIGFSLILRNVLLAGFGARRQQYPAFRIQEMWSIGPVSMTPRDLSILVLAIVVLVGVASMLQFSRIGKAMRAVADNRDLAESSGIDVNRVTLYVWGLGGSLSALGGVLLGLNQTVYWQMGFHLLLLMFAAVILGGLGTAYGAMVGGLAIGLVAQLSTLWFSPQLQNAWALAIMVIVLLVRPQGILGRRERVG